MLLYSRCKFILNPFEKVDLTERLILVLPLKTDNISFDCQKKSLNDFCLKEKPKTMNWTKIVALIGLICVVILIAIVLVAIIALICLPQREDPSSATSGSLKTMEDKASQPVLPNTSLTTQNN